MPSSSVPRHGRVLVNLRRFFFLRQVQNLFGFRAMFCLLVQKARTVKKPLGFLETARKLKVLFVLQKRALN